MPDHHWVREFPGAVTVCDREGIILEMNQKAVAGFQEQGGAGLIGSNLLDCHPEPARTQVGHLLATREQNVYTTEKRGVRKLIYQVPWYTDGEYCGFVELSVELPAHMPHFVREG
jgi:hypothetical protein